MKPLELDVDRASFVSHAENFWILLKKATAKEANLETSANKSIVLKWAERGMVSDLLSPLLDHASPAIRYAAAAHLIDYGAEDQSISVLRQLVKDPRGMLAPTAKLFLIKRKISISAT